MHGTLGNLPKTGTLETVGKSVRIWTLGKITRRNRMNVHPVKG
jgi:hypothetical protein